MSQELYNKKEIAEFRHMRKWYEFLRTLETEGGAVVVLMMILVLFFVPSLYGFVWAKEHMVLILGAILGLLKSNVKTEKKDD
jgi:hypothetical protein